MSRTIREAPSLLRRAAVPLTLAVLAALVVLLSVENRRLEKALHLAAQRSAGGLAVGDVLPSFEVAELDGGATRSVEAGGRPSLLFFFTTTCSACEQNLGSWLDLHRRHGDAYRVLGVGLDSAPAIREYARRHAMPFDVVALDDPLTVQGLGLGGVPETVVVGEDGKVAAVHLGLLPEGWDREWS